MPGNAEEAAPPSWTAHAGDNRSVVILFFVVLLMVLAIYVMDRRWRSRQLRLEKVTGIMNQSHAFSLNLVRHFMPSFKVQKYQFRGMQAKAGTCDIEFEDLTLELPNGKRVLKGVTGNFKAGRMCAIMGPSGAGKTTFMNTLCGKATYGKMAGTIRLNGKTADICEFKSVTGFVPQDDIVHQDLTVREQIEFSAKLRNSPDMSSKRITDIVQDVLNVMQIDHIQNSIVGGVEQRGISGGQRKRVNIGLELAAQPTVLFLDEPTSGLDSTSSLAVALSLQKMCQLGMTSIMVIHQPRYSLFTLFDDVLLLGKGGETVFLGPSSSAKNYFESKGFDMPANENPADWFMDVICGEVNNASIPDFRAEMLFEMWQKSRHETTPCSMRATPTGRMISEVDDQAVLHQKLTEEWDRIDENGDGVMEADELHSLLAHCSSLMPDANVVTELMERMAGKEATEVTKKQFLNYLCSLSANVASDQTLAQLDRQGLTGPHRRGISMIVDDAAASGSEDSQSRCDDDVEANSSSLREQISELDPLKNLKREIPGFRVQCRTLLRRRLVQWWRMNTQRAIFLVALFLGAVVLGALDTWLVATPRWSAMSLLNLHTALCLLLAIFCLHVFGNDQPVFWRESSSGINVLAYFEAKTFVNSCDIVVFTFLFTSVYFLIRQPHVPFWRFFIPFLFAAYVASGWGYFVSTLVPPKHGPFVVSLIMFILCGLLGNPSNLEDFLTGGVMEVVISSLSITRWSIQMNFDYEVKVMDPHPGDVKDQAMLALDKEVFFKRDWGLSYWWAPAIAMTIMGSVLRIGAFLGLRFTNRDKQV